MSLLTFYHLSQSYGAVDIFSGLSANMPHQARIGLVGANGIGKTTLLRILAGLEKPTGGQVHLARGTRLGYLRQEAEQAFAAAQNTVYTEMLTVFPELRQQQAQLRQMEADMGQGELTPSLLEAYGVLLESFEQAGGYDYELRIQQVLTGLGFAGLIGIFPWNIAAAGRKRACFWLVSCWKSRTC